MDRWMDGSTDGWILFTFYLTGVVLIIAKLFWVETAGLYGQDRNALDRIVGRSPHNFFVKELTKLINSGNKQISFLI